MPRHRLFLPLLAVALWLAAGAAAADPTPSPLTGDEVFYPRNSPEARQHKVSDDSFPLWGMLGLVAVLGGAGFYILRRGQLRPRGATGATQQHLAIEETRSLGNKQFLAVAAYGERKLLLSVCPGRVELLCRLDDPVTARGPEPVVAPRREVPAE